MSDFLVSEASMQKLADADSTLADLVMGMMLDPDTNPEALNPIMEVGLSLYELQYKLVELGLAEKVLDRSDREEAEANV